MHSLTRITDNAVICKSYDVFGTKIDGGLGSYGTYTVESVSSLSDLLAIIEATTANECLVLGVPKDDSTKGRYTTKKNRIKHKRIALCGDDFKPTEAGLFLVDCDDESQTPEALIAHLEAFSDVFKGVEWLQVNSSSALLIDDCGQTIHTKKKYHLYCLATHLQNATHFVKAYESWAVEHMHSHYITSKNGSQLLRFPLDTTVYKSMQSRKVFESVGLAKGWSAPKQPKYHNQGGGVLDLSCFNAPATAKKIKKEKAPKQVKTKASPVVRIAKEKAQGVGVVFTHNLTAQQFNQSIDSLDKLIEVMGDCGYEYGGNNRFIAPEQTSSTGNTSIKNDVPGDYQLYCFSDKSPFVGVVARPFDYLVHYKYQGVLERAVAALEATESDYLHHYSAGLSVEHLGGLQGVAGYIANRQSFYLQAHLGDGKSQTTFTALKAQDARVLYINHSRGLSASVYQVAKSKGFIPSLYTDNKDVVDAADFVITTINSLVKIRGDFDYIVIDEVVAVSDVLFASSGIMRTEEQYNALCKLKDLVIDTPIILLDGDLTPTSNKLARILGVNTVYKVAAQYKQPTVNVKVPVSIKGKTIRQSPIPGIISTEETGVLVSDSKEFISVCKTSKENLLSITGENSGEALAQSFLSDVEEEAKKHKWVGYTSVMGCGVSITQVSRKVYGHYTGTVSPQSYYQMLRRYRVCDGDIVISSITRASFDKPMQQSAYYGALVVKFKREVNSFQSINNDTMTQLVEGQAIHSTTKALIESDANAALLKYLKAVGVTVTTDYVVMDEVEVEALVEAKEEVKQQKAQMVVDAGVLSDAQVKELDNKSGLTSLESACKSKTYMIKTLFIDEADLTKQLAYQCLNSKLLSQVMMYRKVRGASVFEDGITKDVFSFVYNVLRDHRPSDTEDKLHTTSKALVQGLQAICAKYDKDVIADFFLHVCKLTVPDFASDLEKRWLGLFLECFGIEKVSRKTVMGKRLFCLAVNKQCADAVQRYRMAILDGLISE